MEFWGEITWKKRQMYKHGIQKELSNANLAFRELWQQSATSAVNICLAANIGPCVWVSMCGHISVFYNIDNCNIYRGPIALIDWTVPVCPGLKRFTGCRAYSGKVPGKLNKLANLPLCANCSVHLTPLNLQTNQWSRYIIAQLQVKSSLEAMKQLAQSMKLINGKRRIWASRLQVLIVRSEPLCSVTYEQRHGLSLTATHLCIPGLLLNIFLSSFLLVILPAAQLHLQQRVNRADMELGQVQSCMWT